MLSTTSTPTEDADRKLSKQIVADLERHARIPSGEFIDRYIRENYTETVFVILDYLRRVNALVHSHHGVSVVNTCNELGKYDLMFELIHEFELKWPREIIYDIKHDARLLAKAVRLGYTGEDVILDAAADNDIKTVLLFINAKCKWPRNTLEVALRSDDRSMEFLEVAHRNKCPATPNLTKIAAEYAPRSRVNCRAYGCEVDYLLLAYKISEKWDPETSLAIVKHCNEVNTLIIAVSRGCPWHPCTTLEIAKHHETFYIRFAMRCSRFKWHPDTPLTAAKYGNAAVLVESVMVGGLPISGNTIAYIESPCFRSRLSKEFPEYAKSVRKIMKVLHKK